MKIIKIIKEIILNKVMKYSEFLFNLYHGTRLYRNSAFFFFIFNLKSRRLYKSRVYRSGSTATYVIRVHTNQGEGIGYVCLCGHSSLSLLNFIVS